MIDPLAELRKLGIAEPEKSTMFALMEALELRVGTSLIALFSDDQLDDFEKLQIADDPQVAAQWLGRHAPTYPTLVLDCLHAIIDECRTLADSRGVLPTLTTWPVAIPAKLPPLQTTLWCRGVRLPDGEAVALAASADRAAVLRLAHARVASLPPESAEELTALLAAVQSDEIPYAVLREYCERTDDECAGNTQEEYLQALSQVVDSIAGAHHGRPDEDTPAPSDGPPASP